MNGTSAGFAIGIMVGLVIVVLLFKYANKDGRIRTEYDERQKTVRGKAYRFAFYAELFAQAVLMWVFMSGIKLPVEDYALLFIAVIFGCLVLATYCIWNDVYWGLNNDRKRYHIIFIIAIILNIIPVAGAVRTGTLFENGKLGMPMLNIVVLVMIAYIYLLLLVKKIFGGKADGEEE